MSSDLFQLKTSIDRRTTVQLKSLLLAIYEYYGYDFRDYAMGTLKRRITQRMYKEQVDSLPALLEKVLYDSACLHRLLDDLSITVSTMFRDPSFFLAFRNIVVPQLRHYPFIRIWHVGCGKGEEVYSMAILLHEEGLYHKCRLYATDMNEKALQQAQRAIYPLKQMQTYTRNYFDSGGCGSFSQYYTAKYGHVIFRPWLKKNILFSKHNLTTDRPFNEFHIILCRNVMIYFNRSLKGRVHHLLYDSLSNRGFLALGQRESIRFTPHEACYKVVDDREKVYRKYDDYIEQSANLPHAPHQR